VLPTDHARSCTGANASVGRRESFDPVLDVRRIPVARGNGGKSLPITFHMVRSAVRPLFDKGVDGSNPQIGAEPADAIWGVGKKTREKLRTALDLPAGRTPTVADFAFAPLDSIQRAQRKLLASQQSWLVNDHKVTIDQADPRITAELRANMEQGIAQAIEELASGNKPGWLACQFAEYAKGLALGYGVYGSVAPATPEERAAAEARGFRSVPGELALTIRNRERPGAVLLGVDPHKLIEPAVVTMQDGSTKHGYMGARGRVAPARAFVIEYPTDPHLEIRTLGAEAVASAAAIWSLPKPERPAALEELNRLIEAIRTSKAGEEASPHLRAQYLGTLQALEGIAEATAKHLDLVPAGPDARVVPSESRSIGHPEPEPLPPS
jgi:hypothetical protein